VVLFESHDFAKGTSSRATKLLHGGVRYLAQGHIGLVQEALRERTTVLRNAPHLSQALPFVMPAYRWWEQAFYGTGLRMYDLLAGSAGLGRTECLNRHETLACLPTAQAQGLWGGVRYWDAQFNDARLALALARTAALHGALLLNHCPVTGVLHDAQGQACGVKVRDACTQIEYEVAARCVVNATGIWVDELRQSDAQGRGHPAPKPLVSPSQGVHLVVDSSFFPGHTALLVPHTSDGRVLFAVPWLGKVILGTTDTPRPALAREPQALAEEVAFILGEAARYLWVAPSRSDVRSIWVGMRPLVKPEQDQGETSHISREHTITISTSGLVTVTGGKWTTYRAMAEDVLARCLAAQLLPPCQPCTTAHLKLLGARQHQALPNMHHGYGDEWPLVQAQVPTDTLLCPGLTESMVRFAARHEYALTVEDVLARRNRLLFLDAALALRVAPTVARLLEAETGLDPQLAAFEPLVQQYLHLP
jgi:glycerol-3-phosphate dehydrogenase